MSKHVAIYIRVSSKQQDQRSQEPDLKHWIEGQEEPVVWYRDKFTGRVMERPGMRKLMAEINAGRVSAVVVWRLDRLGRTAKGLTALFEDFRDRGVGLVSLKDGLDLSTPAGRLMANVLASVAAFETEIRAERVLAGQAAARAAGKEVGRLEEGAAHHRDGGAACHRHPHEGRGQEGCRHRQGHRSESADSLPPASWHLNQPCSSGILRERRG